MQILVEVASIQMKFLKTDEGMVSMVTAIVHGLGDPKKYIELMQCTKCIFRKGIKLIFLTHSGNRTYLLCSLTVTNFIQKHDRVPQAAFSFLCKNSWPSEKGYLENWVRNFKHYSLFGYMEVTRSSLKI